MWLFGYDRHAWPHDRDPRGPAGPPTKARALLEGFVAPWHGRTPTIDPMQDGAYGPEGGDVDGSANHGSSTVALGLVAAVAAGRSRDPASQEHLIESQPRAGDGTENISYTDALRKRTSAPYEERNELREEPSAKGRHPPRMPWSTPCS